MFDATRTIERADLILDELATLGLGLARSLAQRAEATEDDDQAARLAMAFAQVSRSVRHALALQAKLAHDAQRHLREARDDEARQDKTRRELHAARVRSGVRRVIGAEAAEREHIALLSRLELALLSDSTDADFLEATVERHIARLCRMLGVSAPDAADPPRPSSPSGGGGPRSGGEGLGPLRKRPSRSAEFILGPASGRTRGLTAPPEGEHGRVQAPPPGADTPRRSSA